MFRILPLSLLKMLCIFVEIYYIRPCCILGEHITINGLQVALKKEEIFSFSRSTLYQLLPEIGFKYKTDDNRRALCEKMNVLEQCITFLRKYERQEALNQLSVNHWQSYVRHVEERKDQEIPRLSVTNINQENDHETAINY